MANMIQFGSFKSNSIKSIYTQSSQGKDVKRCHMSDDPKGSIIIGYPNRLLNSVLVNSDMFYIIIRELNQDFGPPHQYKQDALPDILLELLALRAERPDSQQHGSSWRLSLNANAQAPGQCGFDFTSVETAGER